MNLECLHNEQMIHGLYHVPALPSNLSVPIDFYRFIKIILRQDSRGHHLSDSNMSPAKTVKKAASVSGLIDVPVDKGKNRSIATDKARKPLIVKVPVRLSLVVKLHL